VLLISYCVFINEGTVF